MTLRIWHNDTQHSYTQFNDTQYSGTKSKATQHNCTRHFDVDANVSLDPNQWILKYSKGSRDSGLELSDQIVQKRGRVGRFGASALNCVSK